VARGVTAVASGAAPGARVGGVTSPLALPPSKAMLVSRVVATAYDRIGVLVDRRGTSNAMVVCYPAIVLEGK